MRCSYCGVEIEESLMMCTNCGAAISVNNSANHQTFKQQSNEDALDKINQIDLQCKKALNDEASMFTRIISSFPIIGIIIFFANRKDYPKKAKIALRCAVIGFLILIGLICAIADNFPQ